MPTEFPYPAHKLLGNGHFSPTSFSLISRNISNVKS